MMVDFLDVSTRAERAYLAVRGDIIIALIKAGCVTPTGAGYYDVKAHQACLKKQYEMRGE